MIRVLMKGEWYEQVDPGTLYEAEFERLLCQQAEYVFPGFWICPCKLPVESEYGSAKPDLALIDRQYREWMVIELELGHHSFEGHVLPQVRRLRHGVYTARHAAYLHQKRPSLNRSRLADMIKGEQPKIMVLADEAHEEWTEELRRLSVGYYAFKVFRSDTEQYLFLTDLSLSALPAATVSYCRRDGVFASWLRLFSPAGLPVAPGGVVKFYMDGKVSIWKRLDTGNCVYLVPQGRSPLGEPIHYEILRRESGELELRPRAPDVWRHRK